MGRFRKITVSQIAKWLGLSDADVWEFARNLERRFLPTRTIIVNGKKREIDVPNPRAKKRLRKLHRALQRSGLFHGVAHGGPKGRSIFTSAAPHTGKRFIWTRDAKDCFPSIDGVAMKRELKEMGFACDVAQLLTLLFVIRGRVPQGSPLSNDALNLYFYRLDQYAASSCGQIGFSFSRVADDLVLSGNLKTLGDELIRKIEVRVQEVGLEINDKKRRQHGLQSESGPQYVHNLLANTKHSVRINKEHRQIALAISQKYVEMARRLDAFSLPAVADVRARVVGYFHFLNQGDKSPVKMVKQRLRQGDQIIKQKLERLRLTSPKGKWWLIVRQGKRKRNEPLRLSTIWKKRLQSREARNNS